MSHAHTRLSVDSKEKDKSNPCGITLVYFPSKLGHTSLIVKYDDEETMYLSFGMGSDGFSGSSVRSSGGGSPNTHVGFKTFLRKQITAERMELEKKLYGVEPILLSLPINHQDIAKLEESIEDFLKRKYSDYSISKNNCADAVLAFLIKAKIIPENTPTWGIVTPYYAAKTALTGSQQVLLNTYKDSKTLPNKKIEYLSKLIELEIVLLKFENLNYDADKKSEKFKEIDKLVNSLTILIFFLKHYKTDQDKLESLNNTIQSFQKQYPQLTYRFLEYKAAFPLENLCEIERKKNFISLLQASIQNGKNYLLNSSITIPSKYSIKGLNSILERELKTNADVKNSFKDIFTELNRKSKKANPKEFYVKLLVKAQQVEAPPAQAKLMSDDKSPYPLSKTATSSAATSITSPNSASLSSATASSAAFFMLSPHAIKKHPKAANSAAKNTDSKLAKDDSASVKTNALEPTDPSGIKLTIKC